MDSWRRSISVVQIAVTVLVCGCVQQQVVIMPPCEYVIDHFVVGKAVALEGVNLPRVSGNRAGQVVLLIVEMTGAPVRRIDGVATSPAFSQGFVGQSSDNGTLVFSGLPAVEMRFSLFPGCTWGEAGTYLMLPVEASAMTPVIVVVRPKA